VTAPSAGFLLIDGYTFVNNEGLAGSYQLSPKIDGSFITPMSWAALEDGIAHFTLNYAVSTPVAAGTHTVTQELLGPGGGNSFYNANHLNALFVPQGSVSVGSARPSHGPAQG
jgi:hypothetical protein